MSTGWESVLQQALALPPQDRACVVAGIEQSMGDVHWPPDEVAEDSPDAIHGAAFIRELQRRSAAYQAGNSVASPAEEVIARLLERQAAEDAM